MAKPGPASIVTPALTRRVKVLQSTGMGTRPIAKKLGLARGTILKALRANQD